MDERQRKLLNTRLRVRKHRANKKIKAEQDQLTNSLQGEERKNDSTEISQHLSTSHAYGNGDGRGDLDSSFINIRTPINENKALELNGYVPSQSENNFLEHIEIVDSSSGNEEPDEENDTIPYVRDETEIQQDNNLFIFCQDFSERILPAEKSTSSRKRTRSSSDLSSDLEHRTIHDCINRPRLQLSESTSPGNLFPGSCREQLNHEIILGDNAEKWSYPIDATVNEDGILAISAQDADIEDDNETPAVFNRSKGIHLSHDQFSAIMSELTSIKRELSFIKTEQRNQSYLLANNGNRLDYKCRETATDTWTKTFGVDFPLTDLDTLHKVENQLAASPELKKILCSPMTPILDTDDTLQKNVTALMKKLLSRQLATKFTATRKMTDKIVFATSVSNIYHSILEVLCATLQKSETKVASAIGTAFTQSQYWDGNRSKISKVDKIGKKQ